MNTGWTRWAALALLLLAPAAIAQPDPRYDPDTGRERAIYPPPRHFDHLHMRLAIDIPTMTEPRFDAVETLRVAAIGSPRDELVLDAAGLNIRSVMMEGSALAFAAEGGRLSIRFPTPVEPGKPAEVVISYSTEYGANKGTGLTWSPGSTGPNVRSETDRWPQIHSQGQPQYNHTWFACHDFPNERLTTELLVTLEDGYQVCSNGRLVGAKRAAAGRTTWHWLQDKPHANYLVVMVIGKFAIVGLDTKDAGLSRPLPVYLYAPLGSERTAQGAYADTPRMLAFFEQLFDEPYPWDKYAQLLVRNFAAGGMENTSATTMQASSAYSSAGSQNDVISHEACHQWTGDLLTCKSWEHAWLNEGWASMGEALWAEHEASQAGGPEAARRAYQRKIAGFMGMERAMNRTFAPTYPAMVSKLYNDPFEVFARANNIYSKGAVVLHMLRMRLGDEAFFKGVRLYIDRFKFKEVETDDFRRALEDASGLSLEQFFGQWVYRPGLPRLSVELEWDDQASALGVTVTQMQRIDADNPAFVLRIPVYIRHAEGEGEYVFVNMDGRTAQASFRLRARPADVLIDPSLCNAAPTSVRKPLAMWMLQLDDPASLFSRLQAAEHLARFADPSAGDALLRVALDDMEDPLLRDTAANALGARALAGLARESIRTVATAVRTHRLLAGR